MARYVGDLADTLVARDENLLTSLVFDPRLRIPGRLERYFSTSLLRPVDALVPAAGDIYHLPSPFEGFSLARLWPAAARRNGCRLVVTLFDLIPLHYPDRYLALDTQRWWYASRVRLLQVADQVHTISQATADDAIARLGLRPERVRVVGAGVSPLFRPSSRPPLDRLAHAMSLVPELRPGFVLCTGGSDWRKNLTFLLVAYRALPERLRRDHQLVIACKLDAAGRRQLEREIVWSGLDSDVLLTGYVPDETLLALYQATELFVLPSRDEGFGLPVAEALACGAPAICANVSSLPEILADPEAHFDPDDPRSIRQALERALTDPAHLGRLRSHSLAARHRWPSVAERTLEGYRALAMEPRATARRRRLALVSPLPPTPSGVADYSFRLATELASLCDVTVFVDDDRDVVAPPGVDVRVVGDFDRTEAAYGPFAAVLCAVGNQIFHISAIQLLRRRSCAVLLHDVRLDGLWAWAAMNRKDFSPTSFYDRLQAQYRGRVPPDLGARGWLERDEAEDWGIWMVGDIVRAADRTFCHSRYGAEAARLDAGDPIDAAVEVLPFGHPSPMRRSPTPDGGGALVATFGVVTAIKALDAVLTTMLRLAAADPRLRCALVGTVTDDVREQCLERAAAVGLVDRLVITGWVPPDEYRAWLQRTTVALQLRAATGGETSAAIADCLAAGVPTVVTRLGAQADLDPAGVELVDRSITAEDLAATVRRLLDDPARRQAMTAASQQYARDHSFRKVAHEVYRRLVTGDHDWGEPRRESGAGSLAAMDRRGGVVVD